MPRHRHTYIFSANFSFIISNLVILKSIIINIPLVSNIFHYYRVATAQWNKHLPLISRFPSVFTTPDYFSLSVSGTTAAEAEN